MVQYEQNVERELTQDEYFTYVNQFATDAGIPSSQADSFLKNAMTQVKTDKGLPQGGVQDNTVITQEDVSDITGEFSTEFGQTTLTPYELRVLRRKVSSGIPIWETPEWKSASAGLKRFKLEDLHKYCNKLDIETTKSGKTKEIALTKDELIESILNKVNNKV